MNMFLAHMDLGSIILGVIVAAGIILLFIKLAVGWWLSFLIDILTFWAVFAMHGGTQKGGFVASISALIVGLTLTTFISMAVSCNKWLKAH